jgi:hypothetical protein
MLPVEALSKHEVLELMPSLRDRLLAQGGALAEYVRHLLDGTDGPPGLAERAAAAAGDMRGQLEPFIRMVAHARGTDFTGLEQHELGLHVPG